MEKIEALAQYLGIDVDEIEESGNNEFETPEGDYTVLTADEADEWSRDEEEMLFYDMGLDAFSPNFQDWILSNAIDEDSVNDIVDSDLAYFRDQEEDEDMVSYLESLDTFDDKLNYIKDLYGDGFNDWAKDNIDFDTVYDEVILWDGRGPLLAAWDGEEIELPGGLYAYRQN